MIIIYRINDENVKSINDLIYFYYSILTANAYLDGEIRIYTTFNYYEFFAYLPFEFYPDFRNKEIFEKDVLSTLNEEYILVDNPKKLFFECVQHTNFMSINAVISEIKKISLIQSIKLINKIRFNDIKFI